MIFYFSGTGNSQSVAMHVGRGLNDNVISMHEVLMDPEPGQWISNDKPFVFVVPTYAWRMPQVVEEWIQRTTFQGCQNVYVLMTCGGDTGNARKYIKRLCEKKGLRLCGFAGIVMPDNYIVMFPSVAAKQKERLVANAYLETEKIIEKIKSGIPFGDKKSHVLDRVKSSPVNFLFYKMYVQAKGFHVTDQCIGCSLCEQTCPLHNIEMSDRVPQWHQNCTQCMACISVCPTKAIEYKKKTQGKQRYFLKSEDYFEIGQKAQKNSD